MSDEISNGIELKLSDAHGNEVSTNLSVDEAERLALHLIQQVNAEREIKNKPLDEQVPFLSMPNPIIELGWHDDRFIVMALSPADFRPIWVLLDRGAATQLRDGLARSLDMGRQPPTRTKQ